MPHSIYYDKQTKDIKMFSKQDIEAKGLDFVHQNLTEQQMIDLGDTKNKRQVINGAVVITKPDDEYTALLNQINLVNNAKDIKPILISVINKIFNK